MMFEQFQFKRYEPEEMDQQRRELFDRLIAETAMKLKMCAGLIDQDRRIGNDPVGHACGNLATERWWIQGFSWPVCGTCAAMLRANNGRVTLPGWKAEVGKDG
jgi:hypothetical protein